MDEVSGEAGAGDRPPDWLRLRQVELELLGSIDVKKAAPGCRNIKGHTALCLVCVLVELNKLRVRRCWPGTQSANPAEEAGLVAIIYKPTTPRLKNKTNECLDLLNLQSLVATKWN